MNKIVFGLIIISILASSTCKRNQGLNSCIDTTSIKQRIIRSSNYLMDTLLFSKQQLFIKIRLKETDDYFVPQIEREFVFYLLSSSIKCGHNELDSVNVLITSDSIPYQSLEFKFNFNDIVYQLHCRDTIKSNYYSRSITYLMNSKDYKLLSIILISYFGDVIHNDNNGMHSDVDFFKFLLIYSNDIEQGRRHSSSFFVLDKLKEKIQNDLGLHLDIKNECIDFIIFLKSLNDVNVKTKKI